MQTVLVKSFGVRPLPQRCSVRRAAQTQVAEAPAAPSAPSSSSNAAPADNANEIYIGFAKGDTAPRAGRKGRVIRDDPKKYPSKEDLGLLSGATGGWAGGEAGLWKLREQVIAEKSVQKAAAAAAAAAAAPARRPAAAAGAKPAVPKAQGGRAPIYVGHGKGDYDLRRAGAPGRFVLDDPALYPSKEDVGILAGATGGFAAGEKGVKQFVRDGELRLRRPGEPGGQGGSPVALAGLLALAGAGGGLLLNGAVDVTEAGVRAEILNAPVDDKTKSLLLAAVALLGAAGLVAAGRAAVASLQARIAAGAGAAQKLVLLGAFWVGVFLAARAVLEI